MLIQILLNGHRAMERIEAGASNRIKRTESRPGSLLSQQPVSQRKKSHSAPTTTKKGGDIVCEETKGKGEKGFRRSHARDGKAVDIMEGRQE